MSRKLKFLSAFNSPFLTPKLSFYLGKTQLGVPYFFPRKWVKSTPEKAKKKALEEIENVKQYNERNANNGSTPRIVRTFEEYYQEFMKYEFPEPKKIGFDFVGLGYKTTWSDTDYRFEWSPRLSFVFFGYQFAITVISPESDHYWEAWLYYENHTDKTLPKKDRIELCKKNFPLTYKVSQSSKEGWEQIDYYTKILKPEYLESKPEYDLKNN